jgi:hypothetical protein
MNVRDPKYHGQLTLTGVGTPFNHSGTIMNIIAEVLKDLMVQNPRALSNGEKEIVIRIREKPFGAEKESSTLSDKAAQVLADVDDSGITRGPIAGETYEQYAAYLMSEGLAESTALFLASDWYNMPEPEGLRDWLNDSKAVRFRQLNSSQESYDSALPMEYEQLKHYVISTYPQFCESITFRTA